MLEYEGNYQLFSSDKQNIVMSLYHEEVKQTDLEANIHQHMEVLLIVEGSATMDINSIPTFLNEGDIVVIDSMIPHYITTINKQSSFVVMSLMYDVTAFIRDEYMIFHKCKLDNFFDKISKNSFKIPYSNKIAPKIQNVLFEIEHEFLDTEDENVIRSFVILIMSYLLQYSNKTFDEKAVTKTPHRAEIEKTMVYINQHIDQNLTLDKLARVASMNKTYYSTIFKKVTGMTVWEYILNTRVELAISYLNKNNSEFNITEILSMCGFNNATSFNKTFKKITGKTPTEYKNSNYNPCF